MKKAFIFILSSILAFTVCISNYKDVYAAITIYCTEDVTTVKFTSNLIFPETLTVYQAEQRFTADNKVCVYYPTGIALNGITYYFFLCNYTSESNGYKWARVYNGDYFALALTKYPYGCSSYWTASSDSGNVDISSAGVPTTFRRLTEGIVIPTPQLNIGVKVGSLIVSKNSISTTVELGEYSTESGGHRWSDDYEGGGHRISKPRPTGNIRVTDNDGKVYDTPVTYINPITTYTDTTATITFDPTLIADYHNVTDIDIVSVDYTIAYDITDNSTGDVVTQTYNYTYNYGDSNITYNYYNSDNEPVDFNGNSDDNTTITERPNANEVTNSNGALASLVDTIVGFFSSAINALLGGIVGVVSLFGEVVGSLGNIFTDFGSITGIVFGGTIGTIVFLGFAVTLIMIILKR